jgi:hypothetical protein
LHLEQIDIADWLSDNPSSKIVPNLSELLAKGFAKLNIRNARPPNNISFGSLQHGIDITCGLLRLLGTSIFIESTMSATAMKRDVISLLDQNQRLWNVLMRACDCYPQAEKQSSHLIEHMFQSLQDLVRYLSQPRWQSSVRNKVHFLWAQRISEMICISQANLFRIMAEDTASVLGVTIEISSQDPGLASTVYAILQPTAKGVVDEEAVQNVTITKIQVRQDGI